jgi:hypothetical protein
MKSLVLMKEGEYYLLKDEENQVLFMGVRPEIVLQQGIDYLSTLEEKVTELEMKIDG